VRRGNPELTTADVRFLTVSQGIQTPQNPTSRLLLNILASVTEFERELTRERVSAGLKHAKAKGTRIGRPRVVFDRQRALDMRHFDQWPSTERGYQITVSFDWRPAA
jgi:DNA invertase Pin-like site-specific DNA recombinase